MDEFTFNSYAPECEVLQLSAYGWVAELTNFAPDLLFVESAWRGKNDEWARKVSRPSRELLALVEWCRDRSVPTVFWNKEDPVHFNTFLNTAAHFDYVFTTDLDSIGRYKRSLGHDRIYLLPFACQPRVFNPLEGSARIDAFCFAGGYYTRYPERARDLREFTSKLTQVKPLIIYDRHFGGDDPNYAFPEEYDPFIRGRLPFESIDHAYKGFVYGLNLNSVKDSQTMCARRTFELMASNTVVVSNYARSMRVLFGDLAVMSDSGDQIVRRLRELPDGEHSDLAKLRAAALRKVVSEHTYTDRIDYIASLVCGEDFESREPNVSVVGYARTTQDVDNIRRMYDRQSYSNSSLLVVVASEVDVEGSDIVPESIGLELQELGGDLIAPVSADDHYGENYLLDLVLAHRYVEADVVGKGSRYIWSDGDERPTLVGGGQSYRRCSQLEVRSSLVSRSSLREVDLVEWIRSANGDTTMTGSCWSIDPFNYCRGGGSRGFHEEHSTFVDDLANLDVGFSMSHLNTVAEGIPADEPTTPQGLVLSGRDVAGWFTGQEGRSIQLSTTDDRLSVVSTLADGHHEYLWSDTLLTSDELELTRQNAFYVETTPGLDIRLTVRFLGDDGQQFGSEILVSNINQTVVVPPGTAFVRPGIRIHGPGTGFMERVVLGWLPVDPQTIVTRNRHLIVTNQYPTYENLYRNAFLHRRVVGYRENGVDVDIFRIRDGQPLTFHEFEGVDVMSGSHETLARLVGGGGYDSVAVHFLKPSVWEVLSRFVDDVRIAVWIHGVEIQPWHRRSFNYQTDEELEIAKSESHERVGFWGPLLREPPENVKLVFVSRTFADEVMEDYGVRIPEQNLAIIHNPIDTDLFSFEPKPKDQRKRILSIRSFASPKYGNDLTTEAILALSHRPGFEDLHFRIIGDGPLFDECVKPLENFDNVVVERRFLRQDEIAEINREYGVFLCPTRWDSQGVSRDEAMSSGLVAITNAVGAVGEFVDETCAILVPPEDSRSMADAVQRLVDDSELFASLSAAGAQRVREQSASRSVIKAELALLTGQDS